MSHQVSGCWGRVEGDKVGDVGGSQQVNGCWGRVEGNRVEGNRVEGDRVEGDRVGGLGREPVSHWLKFPNQQNNYLNSTYSILSTF